MTYLCLDIGNTRSKIGIFQKEEPPLFETYPVLTTEIVNDLLERFTESEVILSSTAVLDPSVLQALRQAAGFLSVSAQTPLPFRNLYATPHTLGIDRIALAAAAVRLHPGENVLVIDTGTCITLDFVDREGTYHGGSIHPGIRMRLKAMHNFTGKLPLVDSIAIDNLMGNSTTSCLQAGAVNGAIKEIDAYISEYSSTFQNLKVLLTGGDSSLFFSKLKNEIFAHPNLVLTGLKEIALYNAK